ncbi:snRNA-activating protein complex subunit 3 isoform X2 [Atheta coriaria]|uniref:snRNA-activating protein complex subunit 3 isoform X2 n=1 Tax=Dalotia coriaria TaxID=877792 RepID=UPI0031F3628D
MEHLDPKYFVCTKPVDTTKYFNEFSEQLKALNDSVDKSEFNSNLEKTCSIDHLTHEGEIEQTCIKSKLWRAVTIESTATSGHLHIQRCKNKWEGFKEPKQVLSFPVEREQVEMKHCRCGVKYTHEYAILPNQGLTELRDVFKCVHDFGVSVELQHPDEKITLNTKDDYPSGFIFIENCFYNDLRHPNAIEYSKEIIEWAKMKNLTNFKTANMSDVKLKDLKIKLGYPYVYQHQGNCEHLVVFTDMRLLRADEQLQSTKYPYVLSCNNINRIFCMMCTVSVAQFTITECDRLLTKYNCLCKKCVLAYNYRDGKKIGTFKLYPFYDINMTLLP